MAKYRTDEDLTEFVTSKSVNNIHPGFSYLNSELFKINIEGRHSEIRMCAL